MIMIDPRLLSEMLKQSLLQKLNLTSSGINSVQNKQAEFEFSAILENFMKQSSGSSDPSISVAALTPLLSSNPLPYSPIPFSLSKQTSFDSIIAETAGKYDIDAGLVKAVIHTESFFNSNAVSRSGAKGLMQLMDDTGRSLGVENPYDPEQNIQGGSKFLSFLLNKYQGNVEVALAAYNAGPGRIDRLGIATDAELRTRMAELPEETQNYVNKVKQAWQQYQSNETILQGE